MKIVESFITPNEFSRGQLSMKKVLAWVVHWTANPGQDAGGVIKYFEDRKAGTTGYGSAHYAIGFKGDTYLLMPESEVAYHVGTSKIDPASGKIYTDLARAKFGEQAIDHVHKSPNSVTLGVEMCVVDANGKMTDESLTSLVELSADVCKRYSLNVDTDVIMHWHVTAKYCHKWFLDNPKAWEELKVCIKKCIANQNFDVTTVQNAK